MSTCFHCSDVCQDKVEFDNQILCCLGCKTVYQILNGSEMNKYYSIEENPGIRPGKSVKGKYNYLELQEFQDKLVFFQEGTISKVRFFLPQIHCS